MLEIFRLAPCHLLIITKQNHLQIHLLVIAIIGHISYWIYYDWHCWSSILKPFMLRYFMSFWPVCRFKGSGWWSWVLRLSGPNWEVWLPLTLCIGSCKFRGVDHDLFALGWGRRKSFIAQIPFNWCFRQHFPISHDRTWTGPLIHRL